jgi:hypothetical protein
MNKLIALAFILGLSASAAQAMPLASVPTPDGMMIKVEGGCGAGFHRDRAGGCRPNGGGPVVVIPGAVVVAPGAGPCGGIGFVILTAAAPWCATSRPAASCISTSRIIWRIVWRIIWRPPSGGLLLPTAVVRPGYSPQPRPVDNPRPPMRVA